MSNGNNKIKKIIAITTVVTGGTFIALKIIGNVKKRNSVFLNEPEQQNAMVGKKVIFVQDDTEPKNADGVKGHLEAIGDIEHIPRFYEKYIKRAIDVVLSFGGLVVLSPVYAGIALAIIIDDPGAVLFTQKRKRQCHLAICSIKRSIFKKPTLY